METESLLPKPTYGGIKRYMRRRRYQRLDGGVSINGGKKTKTVRLRRSPRRHWRIKAVPRLSWIVRSPLKMLTKLKNAYMNFMLKSMNTDNMFGDKRIPQARKVTKGYSGDAFEARLIFEISKALVASHELYPNDAFGLPSKGMHAVIKGMPLLFLGKMLL
ncbi:hypothetical protein VNO77_21642 [Canavalia gladiata]|uniref:Uncharacterized protein n=1 Tax=Canavalia gladiata TaxID=3824 RepID=A0AAN9QMB8_CANGL